MLTVNIYHLCCLVNVSSFPSMLEYWRSSPSVSPETQSFDLWGGSVLLLSDHAWDVFSCSHSADPQCTTIWFLSVLKMALWMQPGLRDKTVVLRPLVDYYVALKMADIPANQWDPVWWTKGPSWSKEQKKSLRSIKPPGWLTRTSIRALI